MLLKWIYQTRILRRTVAILNDIFLLDFKVSISTRTTSKSAGRPERESWYEFTVDLTAVRTPPPVLSFRSFLKMLYPERKISKSDILSFSQVSVRQSISRSNP